MLVFPVTGVPSTEMLEGQWGVRGLLNCNQTKTLLFTFDKFLTKVKGQHHSIFKKQLSSVILCNILVSQCKIVTIFHLKLPFYQFPNL